MFLRTASEAAQRLGVSASTVYRMARDGQIAHHRIGRRVLFHPVDLEAACLDSRVPFGVRLERMKLVRNHAAKPEEPASCPNCRSWRVELCVS